MELVVGLDVAKGASVVQAFLGRNESYGILESISTRRAVLNDWETLNAMCTRTGDLSCEILNISNLLTF
ncbi:hypothetical protein FKV70_25010 [Paenibacillus ottowii]|uniref:IS110 family transposase n=1 Tax=Paenibacillus ottowii TaxID=2315729 RepID=A0ABY3AXF8_9BACL|nr:hypothetical protein FKV70_25010 [Paenibacillus ottowii]